MPQNDAAVNLGTTGQIAIGAVGSTPPSDLSATITTPWKVIGHTSLDNLPTWTENGGDQSTIGTWQAPSLRNVQTKAATYQMTFSSDQLDSQSFSLYYGVPNVVTTAGKFDVTTPGAIEFALLVIIQDGDSYVGFHASRASFTRSGDISLATDAFTELPIQASFLTYTDGETSAPLFSWLSSQFTVVS